jgi:hypothetical protein
VSQKSTKHKAFEVVLVLIVEQICLCSLLGIQASGLDSLAGDTNSSQDSVLSVTSHDRDR